MAKSGGGNDLECICDEGQGKGSNQKLCIRCTKWKMVVECQVVVRCTDVSGGQRRAVGRRLVFEHHSTYTIFRNMAWMRPS